jgi:hypothetical protein
MICWCRLSHSLSLFERISFPAQITNQRLANERNVPEVAIYVVVGGRRANQLFDNQNLHSPAYLPDVIIATVPFGIDIN